MPMYDFAHHPDVSPCRTRMLDVLLPSQERDRLILCPDCGLPLQRIYSLSTDTRWAEDTIPGGIWLENYSAHPVKVYSHSERKRLLKVDVDGQVRRDKTTGQPYELTEMVRHTPTPGSSRSPHTVDWSAGSIDPFTLENARILVSRVSGAVRDPAPDGEVANDPTCVRDTPLLRLFNEAHDLKGAS